ncbi:multinuclear nonheme iron-dependent oxidase [Mesobacillus stamsii]|uniref:Uncharacterized protein (UPF0276 family) n=1 Tax=Mesobacillus stamsii TaxID=225347 RepID=A0ABU0FYA1_9BACI|nr:DUF692 family multinuclear iron-containing protein [Mesobacillus stamsii]MDQ0414898.1 uncharacterized protein (UPF0276 family) [Mesobacillus stamsii]
MKVGLCYRDFIHGEWIEEIFPNIDFIEIMPDITNVKTMNKLVELSKSHEVEIGFHCLKSSLGSKEGIHIPSLENYYYQYKYCNADYFSDHVAFSHIQGRYLSTVNAIPYSNEYVDILVNNLESLQGYFENLILIENITQNELNKENQFSEGRFFSEVMKKTPGNVKVMFDITNAYVTAINNNIDFLTYISDFPFEDIVCVHVSGYEKLPNGKLRDSHSQTLDTEIIEATKLVLDKCKPKYLLLERDFGVETLRDTLVDIDKLNGIATEHLIFK